MLGLFACERKCIYANKAKNNCAQVLAEGEIQKPSDILQRNANVVDRSLGREEFTFPQLLSLG